MCNQRVGGSNPSNGSVFVGSVAEWLKASDCKSDDVSLRRFKSFPAHIEAGVAQLVEHQPSKLRVAGSSLVSRSTLSLHSSVVEHFHGKEGVISSNLIVGSKEVQR